MKYTKEEFDKHDKKMMNDVAELEQLVEWAQQDNTAFTEVDGVKYGSAHLWREVAEKALDLANQQEWFDRYEDKEVEQDGKEFRRKSKQLKNKLAKGGDEDERKNND